MCEFSGSLLPWFHFGGGLWKTLAPAPQEPRQRQHQDDGADRFVDVQEGVFEGVVGELGEGKADSQSADDGESQDPVEGDGGVAELLFCIPAHPD